jgi:hypothetical protein
MNISPHQLNKYGKFDVGQCVAFNWKMKTCKAEWHFRQQEYWPGIIISNESCWLNS